MIAGGFNPESEYSGRDRSEMPQLLCKDIKTYKLLESLEALVMVAGDSTERAL